jgi:hypothetical protein
MVIPIWIIGLNCLECLDYTLVYIGSNSNVDRYYNL